MYTIMKRTEHQYHYAIRCAKHNDTEIIMIKLTNNMSNSKDFKKELHNINPVSTLISNTGGLTRAGYIKFLTIYEDLFNSVPTSSSEVEKLQNVLANNISFDTICIPAYC